MLDTQYIVDAMDRPIIVVKFQQDPDMGMAFCADLDSENELNGLSLYYIRRSENVVHRTKPEIINTIFHPVLTKGPKPNSYFLKISPLTTRITITQNKQKFVSQIPFATQGKLCKLLYITVDGQKNPLSISFEITASYREKRDSEYEYHTEIVKASPDFAREAYKLLME